MELTQKIRRNRKFLAITGFFAALQLVLMLKVWQKPLIWDSAIYVGMGKYLFTGGSTGLWEVFRPPLLPVVAGALWKIGMPSIGFTRLLALAFSFTGAGAVYFMVRDLYTKREAVTTVTLLLSSSLYFWYSNMLLTGLPASMLLFASLYLVEKENYMAGGALGGLAFLMRFPAAVVGPAAVAYVAYSYRDDWSTMVENAAVYTAAFFAVAAPYLLAMHYYYGSMLKPFIRGVAIPAATANTYMFGLYYVFHTLKSSPLLLAFPLGLYAVFRQRERNRYVFLSGLMFSYAFFTVFPHKEARFALLFLPLLALFGARGFESIFEELSDRGFHASRAVKIVVLASAVLMLASFLPAWGQNINTNAAEYYRAHSNLTGVVAANDPTIMAYGDIKYFPLPPATLEDSFEKARQKADYFSINSCAWYCTPGNTDCRAEIDQLEKTLEANYTNVFELNGSYCNYSIYRAR
ncbi:MAG: glycosyltransferase family 39 protein [Candidatus Nanohaloarchaea archaeon]